MITSTNIGWRSQIICHLEKGIYSLDDKIWTRERWTTTEFSKRNAKRIVVDKSGQNLQKHWQCLEHFGYWITNGELPSKIKNLKPVKWDSKSLTHFATTISCYVNDIEDNGCPVLEASEVPFLMSQLLFKLDPNDNSHFGREKGKKLKSHR